MIPPSYDLGAALGYIEGLRASRGRDRGISESSEAGLEAVNVQPDLGPPAQDLLALWVRTSRPAAILEIGTGLGATACVLGREAALYGGKVLTIEIRPELASVSRRAVAAAGLANTVEIVCGDAREIVPGLQGTYGLILQDGGKQDYLALLDPLVALLAPRGVLVSDDVLFPVMDLPESARSWGEEIDAYNRALRAREDLRTIWLPIGDGLALSARF
jgi:predicted O-methyltransferase YrrM